MWLLQLPSVRSQDAEEEEMDCGSFYRSLPDLAESHILPLVWVAHSQGHERKLFPVEESVGTLRGGRSASELFGKNSILR